MDTCHHVDVHVSIADVDGVTLMKFAELLNCSKDKLPAISSKKQAQELRDLFKVLECNIILQNSITSRMRKIARLNISNLEAMDSNNNIDEHDLHKMREIFRKVVPPRSPITPRRKVFKTHSKEHVNAHISPKSTISLPSPISGLNNQSIQEAVEQAINVTPTTDIQVKNENIDLEYSQVLQEVGYDAVNDVEIVAYVCPFCSKEFQRQISLRNHVNVRHPEPSSNKSKPKFKNESHLFSSKANGHESHEEAVSSSNPSGFYQCHNEATFCKACIRQFSSPGNLRRHNRKVHKELNSASQFQQSKPESQFQPEIFCKVCIRQYASKVEFRKHLKTSKHKLRAASTNAGDEVSNVITRNGDEYGYYCCNSCLRVFGEDEFKKHQQETGHSDSVKVSKTDFK